MNSEDFFYDDGISDSELATIPEEVFSEQSGGKLKLQLEPFRKRENVNFGIVQNTFRLRWQIAKDDITPTEFREQLVSNLGDVIRQHINGMPFSDFV